MQISYENLLLDPDKKLYLTDEFDYSPYLFTGIQCGYYKEK